MKWTENEINYLVKNSGVFPIQILRKKLNNQFKNNRTLTAIKSKIHRLGLSYSVEFDYLTKRKWAKTFGFNHPHSITRWEQKGLKVIKLSSHQNAISIKDMTAFAKQKPHLFKRINKDILIFYFGEEITDIISKSKSYTSQPKKIKSIDGKTFKSQAEASQILGISRRTIGRELKRSNGWLQLVN